MSQEEPRYSHEDESAIDTENTSQNDSEASSPLTEESLHSEGSTTPEDDQSSGSDMAQRLVEAGSGESLIGSDDSESEDHYLAEEEEYIINEALLHDREFERNEQHPYSNAATPTSSAPGGSDSEHNFEQDNEFWESLSPAAPHEGEDEGGDDSVNIADELFKPQRGFAASPEPVFSDFFGTNEEQKNLNDGEDDDEELTVDEESSEDNSSTISDTCSLSTPLIAHVGTSQDLSNDPFQPHDDSEFPDEARHDVPLLVIEDLDGRLIYARAGDGEAVFGSDGEFEFEGDSENDSSDNDFDGQLVHRYDTLQHGFDAQGTGDDGDTTDELPDEDMPFPRLLIGSVAPRGGRNARRARVIAARTRMSSPRMASPTPGSSQRNPRGSSGPSSLSQPIAVDDETDNSDSHDAVPKTPTHRETDSIDLTRSPQSALGDEAKPEMGQFMPALSKSVHRAVIDGSTRAPSPFSTLQSLRGSNRQRELKRRGSEEDQWKGDVFSAPKRARADSANEILARQFNEDHGEVYAPVPQRYESSPEPGHESHLDIGDLLDEDLLKANSVDVHEESSDSDAAAHQRRSGRARPGLNYNAFARWNRIPMGAFRNSQQQGHSNAQAPLSAAYLNSQGAAGTYLLTHPFRTDPRYYLSPPARRAQRTPFRRDMSVISAPHTGSPLHRTLSGPPALRNETTLSADPSTHAAAVGDHRVDGDHFLVSPMLMPVKNSGRGTTPKDLGTPSLSGISELHPRKRRVTRREKRERIARNEEQRRTRNSVTAGANAFVGN